MIKITNSLLEGVTETKSMEKLKKLSDTDKADPSHPSQHLMSETELDQCPAYLQVAVLTF